MANNTSNAEEDEEIRLAMEMAMAAAKNPHLSPAELKKLVGQKNKQAELVKKAQQEKEKKAAPAAAAAPAPASSSWWSGATATFSLFSEAASKTASDLQYEAEKQIYAEAIKNDPQIRNTRRKMKVLRKTLKAHRLQGNRVETRHAFRKQRLEKKLLQLNQQIKKGQKMLTHSNYNVQEYAKAMMRASRKWNKKGSNEELSLEAQLCRNMHQMLTVEKQKAKLKKSSREIKKYMQRCKSWLSDKKALSDMHMMTLDATTTSMFALFEDTLKRQDKLIAKLKKSGKFNEEELKKVDASHLDFGDNVQAGTILMGLRGMPLKGMPSKEEALKMKKKRMQEMQEEAAKAAATAPAAGRTAATSQQQQQQGQQKDGPELYIGVKDDVSVSSRLSDPDDLEGNNPKATTTTTVDTTDIGNDSVSDEGGFNFGSDAPWMMAPETSENENAAEEVPAAVTGANATSKKAAPVQEEDGKKKEGKPSDAKKAPAPAPSAKASKKPPPGKPVEASGGTEHSSSTPASRVDPNTKSGGEHSKTSVTSEMNYSITSEGGGGSTLHGDGILSHASAVDANGAKQSNSNNNKKEQPTASTSEQETAANPSYVSDDEDRGGD